jgi:NADH-quinone oxidoreductase subunit E
MNELSDATREKIRAYFDRYPNKRAVTLPALHLVHQEHRCVSPQAIVEIAELLELTPAEIHDAMSFYGFFRGPDQPAGRRRVWVCRSLSCMLRGGEELLAELAARWGIEPGRTRGDGQVSLEAAECLGACDGAPCVLIDDELALRVTAEDVEKLIGGSS